MRPVGPAALVAAALVAALPSASPALTSPIAGAVAAPEGFDIRLPFESGETCLVAAGYGPAAGSSLHAGTDRTTSANEHYALDFVLPDHPDAGLGQPVVAIAAGTVVRAGWATAGWANYGLRVIVVHDHVDAGGHTYTTVYAHLNALAVAEGEHVEQGQRLGELGDSCLGDSEVLSCPHFGPHLHLAVHRDSTVGGSGTGGSYGGNAVVPEPFDGHEDIARGQALVSSNSGGPVPPCLLIGLHGAVLEEDGPCFRRHGTSAYWHDEATGHGGRSLWTYATDAAEPDNWGEWRLVFETAGTYALRAYVPAAFGRSARARYAVRHAGTLSDVVVSQLAAPDGWLSLGEFPFEAGEGQAVVLEDNTGEPYASPAESTTLAFDALMVSPASDGDGDLDADGDADGEADADADDEADGEADGTPVPPTELPGCACAAALPDRAPGSIGALLLRALP